MYNLLACVFMHMVFLINNISFYLKKKKTAKTVFEAIIFVFVMHPFDVGDRCVVDGVQVTPSSKEYIKFY
jgi:hypothetical protein